jgi:hypothetical protein
MSEITIKLNPNHPAYQELSKSIPDALDEFESITYSETSQPVPSGSLGVGIHEAAEFIIKHHDKILQTLPYVLSTLNNLVRWGKRSPDSKKESKPITVVIENRSIQLPASEGAQRKFAQTPRPAQKTSAKKKKKRSAHRKARKKASPRRK